MINLRSKYPYARIVKINIKKALTLPGVKAVITAEDNPNNKFGVIIQNQQVLAQKQALYMLVTFQSAPLKTKNILFFYDYLLVADYGRGKRIF